MNELLIMAVLIMVFNVLDSATTYLAFRQYPDRELKGEANPFMRWLMLRSGWLAEIVKQSFVFGIVVWLFSKGDIHTLRVIGIMFGLVVLNNSYVVMSRAIAKRELITPGKALLKLLHIRKNAWGFYVLAMGIVGLSYLLNYIIW